MAGVITPLVQAATKTRQWSVLVLSYGCGALIGAGAVGFALGWLGTPIQRHFTSWQLALALTAVGLALVVVDVRGKFGPLGVPSLRRQTCSTWFRRHGGRRAYFMWGLDIGLGLSTIRVTSLYWMLVLVVVALVPPAAAPFVMTLYGGTLGVGLLLAATFSARTVGTATPAQRVLRARGRVTVAAAVVLALYSVSLPALLALSS